MASTINPSFFTAAFPSVTNDLKYVVYKSSDPTVEVASFIYSAPHPAREVIFNGLERTNYIWKLLEMSGSTVIKERASFNIVPDNSEIKYKAPETIEVDITPGLINGATSFTFDGTNGTVDWRGYEIYPERIGQGTMKRGVDFSWNKITGIFSLLNIGDTFQANEFFNVEFEILVQNSASISNNQNSVTTRVVTNTVTLDATDIGKVIIIKGDVSYFEITLPDLTLISENQIISFESGIGAHKCVKLLCVTGQKIDWKKGNVTQLFIGVCERISFYKESGILQYRVHDYLGNFLTVGRQISTDIDLPHEYNCLAMDGASISVTDYARLYEWVLQLPSSQIVSYSGWTTDQTKFSYASAGVFRIPNRLNLFKRNTDGSRIPGTFQDSSNLAHTHGMTSKKGGKAQRGSADVTFLAPTTGPAEGGLTATFPSTDSQGDNVEAKPKNYTINEFILV